MVFGSNWTPSLWNKNPPPNLLESVQRMLKRWKTKVNFSTNTSTAMEGPKNSRNAPITTLEMEETQELRDHVVANLAISSISWVLMARISRIPPFGTFFYLQDVRWGVVLVIHLLEHSFQPFQKVFWVSFLRQWDSNRSKNQRLYRRFFVVLFPFAVLF